MKRRSLWVAAPIAALVAVTLPSASAIGSPAKSPNSTRSSALYAGRPWLDPHRSASARAAALVAKMTLDEKIAEVHGVGYPLFADPTTGYAGKIPANTRLGIPAVYLADSPLGVGNNSTGVTQWADTAALASTWDTQIAKKYGQAYGAEQAGKGHNVALAPTINILRLPTWGRSPETFSEDPYLTAQQAVSEIKGIQSNHVIATAKHFLANNQEVQRSSINVIASQKAREEIYEPAFKAAVQAGVGAIMCSYNQIGGSYACENADTLIGTLRDAWKFDGMVMSDWGALHNTVKAAKSGLDLEMPGAADDSNLGPIDQLFGSYFNTKLKAAVQAGDVTVAELNGMVEHVLTAMFRVGLFDHPLADPATVKGLDVSTAAHQALSTSIAEQGTVLLKNARSVLPLNSGRVGSIAVIGDAARNPLTAGGGSAAVTASSPVVSPLEGITARAPGASVSYAQGTLGTNPLPAVPATAFGSGLKATYYASVDLSGAPVASETVPDLDYQGNPAAVSTTSPWSARYKGTITAPASGTYRFSLQAGAYATVYIDNKKVVSFLPTFEPTQNGLVQLTAGAHSIRVIVTPYVHKAVTVDAFAVTAGLHLGWQPQENLLVAQAAAAARTANVAIVVASAPASEGWDRSTLALPADQDELISAVAAANPRTIVVLNTASAVTMPWLSKVAGVTEVWFPGQTAGTAIASVLFGDVNPSGKLPVTFPASDQQGPARSKIDYPGDGTDVYYSEGTLVGYRWFDSTGQKPLFPFGFGLSYTTFDFSALKVRRSHDGYEVSARVANTGTVAGSEVAQLYVGSPSSANEPPHQLKGYTKVALRPGQSSVVRLSLPRSALAAWMNSDAGWVVAKGKYTLYLGDSSRNLPLQTSIRV
ncbi:beta-glucosidase [Jatrophihabitans sp. GAS493]|uniref:beta-glucosidase family protein n=1 Tax=Jatrophihabitans sp. GAS493 TaxID=1907575 RepID=UPI000BB77024|nr:glycoside hydrolase family 3 C-terminal domain-containing protein [Jatrophihabitans sp. GAS493]SOD73636.1 beta-glucosidase [Jatrophihabitans sp. GAS493]